MEPNRREFIKQCAFQKFCNTVLHNEACDAHKELHRHMGDVPRIELFARSRAPGWDVWGNEAAGSIQGWPPQENIREVS